MQNALSRYRYKPSDEDLAFVRALPPEKLPRIACVVPSYNQKEFLPRTLDSILGQNYPALEIFVADGGSTDGSVDILEQYATAHPDIFHYDSTPDGGQAGGVNKAIRATSGDIIAWINSDDLYLPETLWKVATFFYYNRCALVVFGGSTFVNGNMEHIADFPVAWSPQFHEFKRIIKHSCVIPQPSLFFKRSALDLGGGLRAGKALDYELWMRWLQNGISFYYYDDIFTTALVHSAAISANANKSMLIDTCLLVHKYYNCVPLDWCMVIAHNHAYGAAWTRGEYPPYTRAIRCHAAFLFLLLNGKWLPWAIWRKIRQFKNDIYDNLFGRANH